MTKKKKSTVGSLSLPAHLDLTAAGPLHQQLLGLRGVALEIDASKVESLGGQCLQVLLSAVGTWRSEAVQLTFTKPSVGFESGLLLLGLSLEGLTAMEISQ